MRIQARLLLGLFSLAVPSAVTAAPFGDNDGAYVVTSGQPAPQPAPHTHKGLFGRRHCVECQRAYVKAHDGVDVPAPPAIEQGAAMHELAASSGTCATCQGNVVSSGPGMMVSDAHSAPGYAVVGGPGAMASTDAPGYAVVGEGMPGADPTPIGVSRSGHAANGLDPRMAAMGGRPGGGQFDPSVVPTSTPPAQVALAGPGHNRPHIIGHLFGVPKFGQMRRAAEDKERQKHAAIAYDQPNTKVTEVPASVVYGKGEH